MLVPVSVMLVVVKLGTIEAKVVVREMISVRYLIRHQQPYRYECHRICSLGIRCLRDDDNARRHRNRGRRRRNITPSHGAFHCCQLCQVEPPPATVLQSNRKPNLVL